MFATGAALNGNDNVPATASLVGRVSIEATLREKTHLS